MIAVDCWQYAHPLIRMLPMKWDYAFDYGVIYPLDPSPNVMHFIETLRE